VGAAAPSVTLKIDGIDGDPVAKGNFISYVVERDMFQPDMAQVVLSNQNDISIPNLKVTGKIEILVGEQKTSIFKGEITGIEGAWKGGEPTRVLIRAMNKMYKLKSLRKSLTFVDKTDQQILSQVVKDANLTLEWKHEKSITYKHVYQHNLSALEFVRMRAARMGCHVWCVGDTIYVKEPDLNSTSGVKLSADTSGNLRSFMPRISSGNVVKKVSVKGWNPETKELITGTAEAQTSPLGSEGAVAASGDHGKEETFQVDMPIWSKEEADAIAKARIRDANLSFLTGEAECAGNPAIDLGKVIEIEANANGDDPFNGKYYVMGVTHKHTMPKGKEGGFATVVKFARDGQGK
jgi:phage protein D